MSVIARKLEYRRKEGRLRKIKISDIFFSPRFIYLDKITCVIKYSSLFIEMYRDRENSSTVSGHAVDRIKLFKRKVLKPLKGLY